MLHNTHIDTFEHMGMSQKRLQLAHMAAQRNTRIHEFMNIQEPNIGPPSSTDPLCVSLQRVIMVYAYNHAKTCPNRRRVSRVVREKMAISFVQ